MSTSVVAIQEGNWTPAQMKLITDVVAKNATPDELKLFMYRCNKMGLDPLKPGMVHFIKYNPNTPGVIVVGIEGFRSIAARSGKLSGIERGVHRDESGNVVAGWCKVYRSDWTHPAHEEVPFEEYTTGKGPWAKMPATMVKKVAEAAALRMAFPDDLGGVYAQEEMDQAGQPGKIVGQQPEEGDGFAPQKYIVNFGRWRALTLEQIMRDHGPEKIASYIAYLEKPEQGAKRKPEQTQMVAEFIERASDFLAAFEMEAAAAVQG